MSEGGISLDRARWKRELDEFERRTGLDRVWVLRDQFRMHVNALVKYTWPQNSSVGGVKMSALKTGKERVRKDLLKVFVPVTNTMTLLDNATIGDQHYGFKTKTGAIYGVDRDLYRPQATTAMMRLHHQKYRRKDGRVTEARGGSERGRNTLNIGRWTFVDKMHVPEPVFRKYLKEVQGHVGRLKAGWNAAVIRFGGKVPVFVSKHGAAEGSANDTLDEHGNGYLEAVNRVPYAQAKIRGVVRFVERLTNKTLELRLQKSLERAERDYNRVRAGGGW